MSTTIACTRSFASCQRGSFGRSGYTPGRNYGVRVTNVGDGKFELAQLVDGVPEEGTVQLTARDLPDGAQLIEAVERTKGVPGRKPRDSLAIGRVLLPPDFGQTMDRDPCVFLKASQRVTSLH